MSRCYCVSITRWNDLIILLEKVIYYITRKSYLWIENNKDGKNFVGKKGKNSDKF